MELAINQKDETLVKVSGGKSDMNTMSYMQHLAIYILSIYS